MTDMQPFPLQSFEEELRAQEQVAKAKEILEEAMKKRDGIAEEARREGLEKGRAEALVQAQKTERERLAPEAAAARDLLRKAAEALQAKRAELVAAAERDLVRLALRIAEKIVKREITASGAIAAENVRRAIELTANRQVVRILVHPDDMAALEGFLPDLRRDFTDILDLAIEGAATVGRGGCVVTTREGHVDATIAAQLEEIERGLLG
jgi:flagellar assembly protein FliH